MIEEEKKEVEQLPEEDHKESERTEEATDEQMNMEGRPVRHGRGREQICRGDSNGRTRVGRQ
jgi:hypothetical protein